MRILKVPLLMVLVAALAVAWLLLLNTSYAWISSASTARVIVGALILLTMTVAGLALGSFAVWRVAQGVKYRWKYQWKK